jgi:hypothetical protein
MADDSGPSGDQNVTAIAALCEHAGKLWSFFEGMLSRVVHCDDRDMLDSVLQELGKPYGYQWPSKTAISFCARQAVKLWEEHNKDSRLADPVHFANYFWTEFQKERKELLDRVDALYPLAVRECHTHGHLTLQAHKAVKDLVDLLHELAIVNEWDDWSGKRNTVSNAILEAKVFAEEPPGRKTMAWNDYRPVPAIDSRSPEGIAYANWCRAQRPPRPRPPYPVMPLDPTCDEPSQDLPEKLIDVVCLIQLVLPEFDPTKNPDGWDDVAEVIRGTGRSAAEVADMSYREIAAFFRVNAGRLRGIAEPNAQNPADPRSLDAMPPDLLKQCRAEVLVFLDQMKAFSEHEPCSIDTIADDLFDGKRRTCDRRIAWLKKEGYIETTDGRRGGAWLTETGRELAAKIPHERIENAELMEFQKLRHNSATFVA